MGKGKKPLTSAEEAEDFSARLRKINELDKVFIESLEFKPRKRTAAEEEMLARPRTEAEKKAYALRESLNNRVDGFGYLLFVPTIVFFAVGLIRVYGWLMGIFCGVLMFAVLELSYRLSNRT